MTRLRHLSAAALVSFLAVYVMPACGGAPALDVTAPEDSKTDMDYDDDEPGGGGKSDKEGGGSEEGGPIAHDPCHEKKCGDPCTECHPADETCDELQVLKQCNAENECVIAPADCTAPPEDKKK